MRFGDAEIFKCPGCSKLIEHMTILSGNLIDARFWTDGKGEAPMLPDQPQLVKCWNCNALLWFDELDKVGVLKFDENDDVSLKEARKYIVPSTQDYNSMLKERISDKKKEKYLRIRTWWAGNDARRQDKFPYPWEKPYTSEELLEAKNKVSESRGIPLSVEKTDDSSIITKFLKYLKGKFIEDKPLPIDKEISYYILRKRLVEHQNKRECKDIPLTDNETANLHAFAVLLDESNENDRIMKAEVMRELCMYEEAMELLKKPFSENLLPFAAKIKSLTEEKESFVREIHGYYFFGTFK